MPSAVMNTWSFEGGSFINKRVLLVEDDPLISLLAADIMELQGIDVVGPAETLAAALAFAEVEQLDAAVLDVNLGKETSFAVAELLKRKGVPFFYTTASANLVHPDIVGERSLAKPYGAKQFFRALEGALTEARDA